MELAFVHRQQADTKPAAKRFHMFPVALEPQIACSYRLIQRCMPEPDTCHDPDVGGDNQVDIKARIALAQIDFTVPEDQPEPASIGRYARKLKRDNEPLIRRHALTVGPAADVPHQKIRIEIFVNRQIVPAVGLRPPSHAFKHGEKRAARLREFMDVAWPVFRAPSRDDAGLLQLLQPL